jgi:hypothetical protein
MTTYDKIHSQEDVAFFEAVRAAFERFPEAKQKYAIANLALEKSMGIDFDRQAGFSRVDGDRIVTEFLDRDDPVVRSGSHRICRKTDGNGRCIDWWEPEV